MVSEKFFDVVAMGEILIDFTFQGYNSDGQRLFAQNAGGAPANVLVSIQKLGGKTAFLGKIGDDMHGSFLNRVKYRRLWQKLFLNPHRLFCQKHFQIGRASCRERV